MPTNKHDRPIRNTLDLCNEAANILKKAGFAPRLASRKSEACYYGWPGRPHLLRVAEHRRKGREPNDMIVASVTFHGNCHDTPGTTRITEDKLLQTVAEAIGRYMIRSSDQISMNPQAPEGACGSSSLLNQ